MGKWRRVMKTRLEAVEMLSAIVGESPSEGHTNIELKDGKWHFGNVELRKLFDAVWGEPNSEDECIDISKMGNP